MISFKRYNIGRLGLLILLPLSLVLLLLSVRQKARNMKTKKPDANEIYYLLRQAGFQTGLAKMITAQAAHETGNFESLVYKKNANPFGMREPKVRQTTATGSNYGHAVFNNLDDAITDYKYYWTAAKLPPIFVSVADFVEALKKKKYFEDSETNYLKGVNYFYNLYFVNSEDQWI